MEKSFKYEIRPIKMFGQGEFIDTGFTGHIQVKIPDYKTRMKLVKDQSLLGDDFEKISVTAMDTASKFIESVDVSHELAGNITSIDELSLYEEGVSIVFDVYNQIVKGWSLSPKSEKPLASK
jgi:hypothetical protein